MTTFLAGFSKLYLLYPAYVIIFTEVTAFHRMKKKYLGINTKNDQQTGFTIIEVMLYLAVVGLVFLIGINAVSGRSAKVQFTDSMRDLHGYITAQYSQFVSGVKPYDWGCEYTVAATPAYEAPNVGPAVTSDGSCILFGKVFVFEAASDGPMADSAMVESYNLVARNVTDPADFGFVGCDTENFVCLDPTVIDSGAPLTHQILWGTEFTAGNESTHLLFGNGNILQLDTFPFNNDNDNVRGFGWLRDPTTSKIIPISFGAQPPTKFTASMLSDPTIYRSHAQALLAGAQPRALIGDFNSAFCFRGPSGDPAMLIIGEGESQEVVTLNFTEYMTTHDCTSF